MAGSIGVSARDAPPAAKNAARSTVPRTPWGHPDLQGTWSNATTTALERPANLAEKATLMGFLFRSGRWFLRRRGLA
jgi:hypothetical protein